MYQSVEFWDHIGPVAETWCVLAGWRVQEGVCNLLVPGTPFLDLEKAMDPFSKQFS